MREIKFRAWCEATKNIYQITDIDFNNYVANGVCNGDWQEFSTSKLLQYTGLKDKNGVEIYEGDIVYLSGIGLTEIEFPFIDLYQACYENDIGAIIGNIYENPELLKED